MPEENTCEIGPLRELYQEIKKKYGHLGEKEVEKRFGEEIEVMGLREQLKNTYKQFREDENQNK